MTTELEQLLEEIKKWILEKHKFGTLTIITDDKGNIKRIMKHEDENIYIKVPDVPIKK